jgi:hypothetical protein
MTMNKELQDALTFRELHFGYAPDDADILNCIGLPYEELSYKNAYVGVFARDCPVYGDSALAAVVLYPRTVSHTGLLVFVDPDSSDECSELVNEFVAQNREAILEVQHELSA